MFKLPNVVGAGVVGCLIFSYVLNFAGVEWLNRAAWFAVTWPAIQYPAGY